MRYQFIPTGIARIKKSNNNKCWQGVENVNARYRLEECRMAQLTWFLLHCTAWGILVPQPVEGSLNHGTTREDPLGQSFEKSLAAPQSYHMTK